MRLFGLEITRATRKKALLNSPRTWWPIWPIVREPYTGAWQRNADVSTESVLSYFAVYACVSLISSDIGKMRLRLMRRTDDGIWEETDNPAFGPVIRRPNHYQNRIKFVEWWITSKLLWGNTYALKVRDNRGVVTALHLLDPSRVHPMIAPDGAVFYELVPDALAQVSEVKYAPAREIIHDVMVPLYHPLVGVSPLIACARAAAQGLSIQNNSTDFFSNGSNPGGVLSAPGEISQETADRIKEYWDTEFTGTNAGKVAVLGQGLSYQPMSVTAVEAQLIEQFKWTAEVVCAAFHVPPHKIGIGNPPSYNNIEALDRQYYSQCLQTLIESLELSLDEGLELPKPYGTELDLDDLLRMDTATMIETTSKGVGAAIFSPNEARRKFSLPPVEGGKSPYLQQQNYSLSALAKRDQQTGAPASSQSLPPQEEAQNPKPPGENVMRTLREHLAVRSARMIAENASVPNAV